MRKNIRKILKMAAYGLILAGFLPLAGSAADKKDEKAKPYPLKTCVVSDEKLGDMGDPYVFTQDGQEVKRDDLLFTWDFKKDSAKYMKKIAKAEKK